jgi:RNA polymerase sigma factor (sigma-70 family)
MPTPSDRDLLAQHHARDKSAFGQLAARHIDWVYSAALRRTMDPHLAEDVTQAVLLALASSRAALRANVLSAWLFGVLRFTAAKAIRSESRHRRHETAAARERDSQRGDSQQWEPQTMTSSPSDWQSLAPHLEEAVASLSSKDRESILLRFYQQMSFSEVAAALTISEEAARKRVTRAVTKLRKHFTAHSLVIPTEVVAATILSHCTQPAPISIGSPPAASSLFNSLRRHRRIRLFTQFTSTLAMLAILLVAADILLQTSPAQTIPTTQPVVASAPVTRPADITVDQLLASIQQTEHLFQNVHVKDFVATTETRPRDQTAWTPSRIRYAGSAWFDADPDGKERLYLTDQVLPWQNGAEPWAESMTDFSWDGSESRELRLAFASHGVFTRGRMAMVYPARSEELDAYTRYWTGLAFTAQYYLMYEELTLPRKPRSPLSALLAGYCKATKLSHEICRETVNGCDAVRLCFTNDIACFSLWFDPSRNYALVKTDSILKLPKYTRHEGLDVLQFTQLAPNIWFPIQATVVKETFNPPGYARYTFRAADVTVNDPNFNTTVFTAKIPTGWVITDLRGPDRQDYVLMPDGSHLVVKKGTVMPHVKAGIATRPDGNDPPVTHNPEAWW